VITKSPEETKELAREFVRGLPRKSPMIIELVGDLGAGKTTFMSGVGEFLGVKESIVSPTFMIQRNYDINGNFPWKKLIHLDAYRIEDVRELDGINWQKYSSDKDNIIFIEWPANMGIDLKADKRIDFKHISEHEREINF
jgi:tRNA threonylcarbamoyladenosine biosynthesis protein TsaE